MAVRCKTRRTGAHFTPHALAAGLCLLLAQNAGAEARKIYSSDSPLWLRAVGKLVVPGIKYQDGASKHHREDCSATLVGNGLSADTLVTAWHCLEYYEDLSASIVFTTTSTDGQVITRQAYRVADGGSMRADWAVMRLYRGIKASSVPAMSPLRQEASTGAPIMMAGYSRDIGEGGTELSYDPHCEVTGLATREVRSNCSAAKGASGGAVIRVSTDGQPALVGVISRGDSAGLSTFVPTRLFHSHLRGYAQ